MSLDIDHLVVLCDAGAPEADLLARIGLSEGSSNLHVGQGTANRRFFFRNAYLELLWVENLEEARREPAFRTRLWERWLRRRDGASPFGIALRPADADSKDVVAPFPTWAYHPPYLLAQTSIGIAVNTPLTEPEVLYLSFASAPERKDLEPMAHALKVSKITGVRIGMPRPELQSPAARAVRDAGLVSFYDAGEHALEIAFDDASRGESADLRPQLPLTLRW